MSLPNTKLPTAARVTRPAAFDVNPGGGLSVIARRGFEATFCGASVAGEGRLSGPLDTREKLLAFAARLPHQLSELLGGVHPTVSKAQANALTMVAAPGAVRLAAFRDAAEGRDARDEAGTAEIERFLNGLPKEVGGLHGLLTKGTMALLHDPPWALEGVPGPRGTGLAEIGLVSGSSIEFGRDKDGRLRAFQNQAGSRGSAQPVPLCEETFFWAGYHASVSNPYGRSVFAAAVAEALKDMAFDKDLADGVHNAAWQRLIYKYSLQQFYDVARNLLGLPERDVQRDGAGNETEIFPAQEWVNARLKEVGDYLATLKPDDNITADAAGGVETLPGGDFRGLEPVIEAKEYRLVRALGELPTTMGLPKTVGQNHTTTEWALQADHYMNLRHLVVGPIVDALNLHFRLRGEALVVRADFSEIRTSDAVQDANALAVRTNTVLRWLDRDLITETDAALMLTGSGLPPGVAPSPRPPLPRCGRGGEEGEVETASLPVGGTTQEERDAAK